MSYEEYRRVSNLKRWLQWLAYASLVLDIAIAVVTLASINIYKNQLGSLIFYLNIALSGEVIVTLVLFFTLLFMSHYQRLLQGMIKISKTMKSMRPRGRMRAKLGIFSFWF